MGIILKEINMNKRKLDMEKINKLKEKVNPDIVDNIGPRQLYATELYEDMSGGWRPGYTKPTIEARKEINRRRNKQARISRRINRKK
jgi:hypothetical protein